MHVRSPLALCWTERRMAHIVVQQVNVTCRKDAADCQGSSRISILIDDLEDVLYEGRPTHPIKPSKSPVKTVISSCLTRPGISISFLFSIVQLLETNTERIAAYAATTPIVAWFDTFIKTETSKENAMIQIATVIKCATSLSWYEIMTSGTTMKTLPKRATKNLEMISARKTVF